MPIIEYNRSHIARFADQFRHDVLKQSAILLYITHIDPDSVGSLLAMRELLVGLGVNESCIALAGPPNIAENIFPQCKKMLELLEEKGVDLTYVTQSQFDMEYYVIGLDSCIIGDSRVRKNCSDDKNSMYTNTELMNIPDVIIDHHAFPEQYHQYIVSSLLMLRDIDAGSTSLLIYELGLHFEIDFSRFITSAMALGTYIDTLYGKYLSQHDKYLYDKLVAAADSQLFNAVATFKEDTRSYPFNCIVDDPNMLVMESSESLPAASAESIVAEEANAIESRADNRIVIAYGMVEGDSEETILKFRARPDTPIPVEDILDKIGDGWGYHEIGGKKRGGMIIRGHVEVGTVVKGFKS